MRSRERVRRKRTPRHCNLGKKRLDERTGHYTYEDKMVQSEYDGLLTDQENYDPDPEKDNEWNQ